MNSADLFLFSLRKGLLGCECSRECLTAFLSRAVAVAYAASLLPNRGQRSQKRTKTERCKIQMWFMHITLFSKLNSENCFSRILTNFYRSSKYYKRKDGDSSSDVIWSVCKYLFLAWLKNGVSTIAKRCNFVR